MDDDVSGVMIRLHDDSEQELCVVAEVDGRIIDTYAPRLAETRANKITAGLINQIITVWTRYAQAAKKQMMVHAEVTELLQDLRSMLDE